MTTIDKNETRIFINIESVSDREEGYDPEEIERITHNLRDDLTEVDTIEKVDLIKKEADKKEAPKGSKAGGEIVTLGSMLVTLGASAASIAIPNLANTLQSWLTRNERHKLILEIGGDKLEVTGISDKEQQRLIDTWISRHTE
ncbi:MAG: hypothetical protein WA364_09725 [Candidatus Nitrosopolaris sp.]